MKSDNKKTAHYHLPGLFEFYDLYKIFLPLFFEHREYFYDWCDIGSIYGAPADCIWGGGRVGYGTDNGIEVFEMMQEYGISSQLAFSNSRLNNEHMSDRKCNELCELFHNSKNTENGIIIYSDLLMENYPRFYFVSSTTKVITDFKQLSEELSFKEFRYVVPDFRFNKEFKKLETLSDFQKAKVEFLCNECCWFECSDRKACYENVSRKVLGENCNDHICISPDSGEGYVFSRAMQNRGFIGLDDIRKTYMPKGFTDFKIEGRSLGSALVLELLLYYLTKPKYQLKVREKIYLNSSLDLF